MPFFSNDQGNSHKFKVELGDFVGAAARGQHSDQLLLKITILSHEAGLLF
jgi:hypothetical protein